LSMIFFGDPIIFRPTGRYAERSVTVTKSTGSNHSTRTRTKSRGKRAFHVGMFTAGYCGYCQTWKTRHKSKVTSRGIPVTEINMGDPTVAAMYGNNVTQLPTFVFYHHNDDGSIRWYPQHTITGTADSDTIINRYNEVIESDVANPEPVTVPAPVPESVYKAPTPPIQIPQTQSRYINWPGWGTIDLETYGHGCNCNMCRTIRGLQQTYRNQQRYHTQVILPDDQQPCPQETVDRMLDLMELQPTDVIADLGCGDGRILIAAAKRGVRGIGVELDPARASEAKRLVAAAGLSHMIQVIIGDARQFDTSKATAITAYLYPPLLKELAPKMQSARVVASPFHEIPGLAMDKTRYGDIWLYHSRVEVASLGKGK